VFSISKYIPCTAVVNNRLFALVDKYSFEIYLYAVLISYLLITTFIRVNGIMYLTNMSSAGLFIVRLLLQIVFSIGIGYIIKRIRVCFKRTNA